MWVTAALSVFLVARIIPAGRASNYLTELVVVVVAALAFGILATALDFGGWRDTDSRAVVFVLLGAAAATGAHRAFRLTQH